jgi:hypothetical protein
MAVVESWESFAVVAGGASATLTGLLFVSVSLNREEIAREPALRASAAQTLVLLTLPLAISALLLTPRQPAWSLSIELGALAVLAGAILQSIGHAKRHATTSEPSRIARLLDRRLTNVTTTLFILAAAVSHAVGHGGGLYWIVPAVLFSLLGGVFNAWIFLIEQTG